MSNKNKNDRVIIYKYSVNTQDKLCSNRGSNSQRNVPQKRKISKETNQTNYNWFGRPNRTAIAEALAKETFRKSEALERDESNKPQLVRAIEK